MLRHLLTGTAALLVLSAPAFAQQQQTDDPSVTTTTVPVQQQETQAQDEQAQPTEEQQPVQEQAQEVAEEPVAEEPTEQQAGVAPEETFIPAQEEGLLLASELMNVTVIDAQDEEIGGIDEVIVDPEGGIFGAVVSVGGFLGIGAKQVALSWNEFDYSPEEQVARLNVTREELEQAPDFQTLADIRAEEEAALAQQQQTQEQPMQPAPAAGQQ